MRRTKTFKTKRVHFSAAGRRGSGAHLGLEDEEPGKEVQRAGALSTRPEDLSTARACAAHEQALSRGQRVSVMYTRHPLVSNTCS
jgi:hypothetical protein